MSKKLIVIADDFGLCKSVNKGIVKAYNEGIVTEISLMLNSSGTENAISLIKKHNLKRVGLHLLLFDWINKGEKFNKDNYTTLFLKKTAEEILDLATQEFKQFEKELGFTPTHICPHQGIHGNLKLLDVIIKYASKNNIPVRLPKTLLTSSGIDAENYAAEIMLKRAKIKTTTYLFAHILGSDIKEIKDGFLKDLDKVKSNEVAEMFVHPGFFDEELMKLSSLNYERARDLTICLDPKFKKDILKKGFKLVNYSLS